MSEVNPPINVRILKSTVDSNDFLKLSQINMEQSFGTSYFANFRKNT